MLFGATFLSPLSASDFSSSAKGTTAASFLKLGVGARALAMGEAYTAQSEDASSLYWNPGALPHLDSRSTIFMHALYIESSFFDYAAHVHPLPGEQALAAGIQYFSSGRIAKRDANGFDDGSFTPNDLAASFGYGKKWGRVGAGASLKYIRSEVINSAQTAALDMGIVAPFSSRYRLALSAKNIGGGLKLDQKREGLPFLFVVGNSFRISDRFQAAFDANFPRDNSPYGALGAEYRIPIRPGLSWAGRLGYNSRTLNDIDGVTGISVGVGFNVQSLSLDYGLVPFGSVGYSHLFSASFRWDGSNTQRF